jgi:hypothetical protein
VEVAERFADGSASAAELSLAAVAAEEAAEEADERACERFGGVIPFGCDPHMDAAIAARNSAAAEMTAGAWGSGSSPANYRYTTAVEVAAYTAGCAAEWETITTSAVQPDCYPEDLAQSGLLRDIFGNPLRAHVLNPSSVSSAIVALSKHIYDEQAFDQMPKLADALQRAGCVNADVLEHCRGRAPHARGCWVLDLILRRGAKRG